MGDEPSDFDLLELWRGGDNRAGSALVKRHFASLYRFFDNRARQEAEDLIQQTFAACAEARDAFRGQSSFRAYLYGLARYQLYQHYRRTRLHGELDFTTTSVPDSATSPSGTAMRHEGYQLLRAALQRVPVDQQIALELTYWSGLAAPELAHVLGIPENTVYSRLRRAKVQLRRALAELSDEAGERLRALGLLSADLAGE